MLNVQISSYSGFSTADHTPHLKEVQRRIAAKEYGFFNALHHEDALALAQKTAQRLREDFEHFVILGTGGSSLGAKTLCDLVTNPFATNGPRLYFLNNVDSHTLEQLITSIPLEKTCFIAISKSGTTAETLCQTFCLMKVLEEKNLDVKKHFVIITEPKDSTLTQVAETYNITPLPHPLDIGGRFSVFSLVGLLPAALAEVDCRALFQGARLALDHFGRAPHTHPALEGAATAAQALTQGRNISIVMPYVDRLFPFAQWYAQLWGESLGKAGQGSTPVAALGTVDQHSQLQLYHDGPDDKIYTFLVEDSRGRGLTPNGYVHTDGALAYFQNKHLGDLLYAEAQATMDSLKKVGRPVRVISFPKLTESVMGEVLVHYMLETILTAQILGVNAFDQPGVEQSKILTRQYLQPQKAS